MISIPREEYERLLDDSLLLAALLETGVDNWEWYSVAIDRYHEMTSEQ
jgi:hypothetical protein